MTKCELDILEFLGCYYIIKDELMDCGLSVKAVLSYIAYAGLENSVIEIPYQLYQVAKPLEAVFQQFVTAPVVFAREVQGIA